jgi:hypothetical protein
MQLAIAFDPVSTGNGDWSDIEEWFKRAVVAIGEKEVCYRLNITASNLSDALDESQRKSIKARWIQIVLRMAPEAMAREYLDILSRQHGFEEPKRKRVKTHEEINREAFAWMERQCPGLFAMMKKDLGL